MSDMPSTLQQRVELAIAAGFKVGKLALAAGKTSSTVSQWRSGEIKAIKGDSAIGLQELTGWHAKWWINGKGPQKMTASPVEPAPIPADDPLLARFLNAYGELDDKQQEKLVEEAETMAAEKLGRELLTNRMGMKKLAPAPDHKVSRAYGTPKKPAKGLE